jgi:hypothetical protein
MSKNPPLTILIIWLICIIGLLSVCADTAGSVSPAASDEAVPTSIPTRAPAEERAKGDLNAPVTLIEYGDYQ